MATNTTIKFEGGREVTIAVPEGAAFTGVCATCAYCDGPLPILRYEPSDERDPRYTPRYWATCPDPQCARQFFVFGVEGPDDAPVFSLIPYHHSGGHSRKWMGLHRKDA